jgi:hypothetical protein
VPHRGGRPASVQTMRGPNAALALLAIADEVIE